jgi:MoaA/NifB/PqqE/SkfB family radical SAM enzyme
MTEDESKRILTQCIESGLKNVRFSGGEPTMYKHLPNLVRLAKDGGVERIAISTNGSAPWSIYEELLTFGVNDFSVSLDACCSTTGELMSGVPGVWERVVETIRRLALRTYVTVGIVATDDNRTELGDTIALAHSLGVADIRVIPAAQSGKNLSIPEIPLAALVKHPVLKYRVWRTGKKFRGLDETDNRRCPLTLDDMAVVNGKHYPCIIYLREKGDAIGEFTTVAEVRDARRKFAEGHDCYADPICRGNCLDVCVEYNNRHMFYHKGDGNNGKA